MPGAGAGAGAFAGIAIANNIARARKGIEAAKTAWKPVAGLTLHTEKIEGAVAQSTGTERPMLKGTVGAVPVTVRIVTDFVHYAVTEIAAVPPSGLDLTLGLYPSPGGMLSSVRDWLRQDIKVGDADFDAAFLITGKPSSSVPKRVMGGKFREHLAGLLGPLVGFEYTKERAKVVLSGIELETATLDTAVALVAEAGAWAD